MSHEENGFPQGAKRKDLFEIYHNCQTIIKLISMVQCTPPVIFSNHSLIE